jgi:hypothetical protein
MKSKVALLNTLYAIYGLATSDKDPDTFLTKALEFYNEMTPQGYNLLKKILPDSAPSLNLEKIIDDRVQTNIDIAKNFSHIVTNALLFRCFSIPSVLNLWCDSNEYLKKIEEAVVSVVSLALKTKTNKSTYDDLIKLFEASVRYSKFSKVSVQNLEELHLNYFESEFEKYYLIDMVGHFGDGKIENEESYFYINWLK